MFINKNHKNQWTFYFSSFCCFNEAQPHATRSPLRRQATNSTADALLATIKRTLDGWIKCLLQICFFLLCFSVNFLGFHFLFLRALLHPVVRVSVMWCFFCIVFLPEKSKRKTNMTKKHFSFRFVVVDVVVVVVSYTNTRTLLYDFGFRCVDLFVFRSFYIRRQKQTTFVFLWFFFRWNGFLNESVFFPSFCWQLPWFSIYFTFFLVLFSSNSIHSHFGSNQMW